MNTSGERKSYLGYMASIFWNFNERRLRALGRLFGAGFFIVILTVINGLLLAGLGSAPAPYIEVLQLEIVFVVAVWLAARFLDRRKFSETGIYWDKAWGIDLVFGLLLGALLMGGIFLVEFAAGWITPSQAFRTSDPGQSFVVAILAPVLFYLVVAIAEELLFRGYLLLNAAEGLNFRFINPRVALIISWLLTSVVFGILHATNPNATFVSTVNIALAGLWLGLGYVLTGSLAIPIGAHFTWNFFQGNVFGLPVSGNTLFSDTFVVVEQGGPEVWTGGAFGPEGGLIGLFALVLGMLLVAFWVRFRYGRLALCTAIADPPPDRQMAGSDAFDRDALSSTA